MSSFSSRLEGGMLGLLVGDALGVPYEFQSPARIPPHDAIEMTPPAGFSSSRPSVPAGTFSDDSSLALALLDSLLEKNNLDVPDVAAKFLEWYDAGKYAVDARVFDVGIQTQIALQAIKAGTDPRVAGPKEERSNGNGALMRVLPLALFHEGTDAELARDAEAQSAITHGHAQSRVACSLYCLWARRILHEEPNAWREAANSLRAIYSQKPEESATLETHYAPDSPAIGEGSGWVVDCLQSARMVIERGGDYEQVVRGAIRLGDDTDTTACVAGGIVGARDGKDAIPARFLASLRGRAISGPIIERLLQKRGRS